MRVVLLGLSMKKEHVKKRDVCIEVSRVPTCGGLYRGALGILLFRSGDGAGILLPTPAADPDVGWGSLLGSGDVIGRGEGLLILLLTPIEECG